VEGSQGNPPPCPPAALTDLADKNTRCVAESEFQTKDNFLVQVYPIQYLILKLK
jgi:hypothetical protein